MSERYFLLLNAIENDNIETFKLEWSLDTVNSYRDQQGSTLLHIAASWCRFEFVKFMLENGVDPNIPSFPVKRTPLMYGWLSDDFERTPVHLILLRYGGNPYLTTTYGDNSFDIIKNTYGFDACREDNSTDYMESYLVVELVCGEADNFSIDLWRVIKHFIL